METIEYKGRKYPQLQTMGNAAQFAIPFALHICKGKGYDIGCNRPEWALPGARPIDLEFDDEWHANNLPDGIVDYIFSSHCLEHVPDWVGTLLYWTAHIRPRGDLFLYLPHYLQEYWRPWNNRKHVNVLTPEIVADALLSIGYRDVFTTGPDLNSSFIVTGTKAAL